jgi:hypothetical protein
MFGISRLPVSAEIIFHFSIGVLLLFVFRFPKEEEPFITLGMSQCSLAGLAAEYLGIQYVRLNHYLGLRYLASI